MPRLALYLLGPPKIECDGLPVKLNRRKAIALLAYLAVTGESHPRDGLVNLLWPELDSTRGRAALRRTLYALNQALAGAWLLVNREEIGLAPSTDPSPGQEPNLWLDVAHFQHLLAQCDTHGHSAAQVCPECAPLLTEAVELVRGDFLSGFSLKDSINFDDWQLFQAERLRRKTAGALERLVDWLSSDRQFELATGYARRKLALDPFDEEAHRQLMRLYSWSGHRSAALRQYEDCLAVLEDQLAVSPQEETTELYRAIQAGRTPPPPQARAKQEALELPPEPPRFLDVEIPFEQPVFVARGQELARLDHFLERALAGQGQTVFVTGEAGSGKTALLQEFARRALGVHSDLVVANGNCSAYTGLGDPYLPFREILELLTGDVEARWAAGALSREHTLRLWHTLPLAAQALVETGPDLVGTFVPRKALRDRVMACLPGRADWLTRLQELVERKPFGPGVPSPQQSTLFEQYTKVLQGLARQVPLALLVDDLQWADLGTISLLFHLGRQLAGSRIVLLGAYRPEEVALGRGGDRHPLEAVLHEFQRDSGDIMLNLGRAKGRDFVEALLNSPASPLAPNRLELPFRDMLYRQTRGHPLFTVELLRGLQERGDLVKDPQGHWVEGPALDWERLPARIEAVIAERIGRLAQPLRSILRVASVEGEVFTAEVVARLQSADGREIVGRLSRDLDRRHRLVRADTIERLGSQRVSRYRFRNYLFQKYLYDNLDGAERAYLHEDVGNVLEELYGDQVSALATIAPKLAWHFQEAGIEDKAIRYLHQAGERAVQLSAYQEAIAHLTRGLELFSALPDHGARQHRLERAEGELALQLSLGMAWQGLKGTQAPEVENIYTRARELCQQTGKTTQLCRVMGQLSVMYYVRAEHHKARELVEEALQLAQQAGDPLLAALCNTYLGFIQFCLGEFQAARTSFQEMIAFYQPHQHHRALLSLRGSDVGVSALAYDSCCLWCLGFPRQATLRSQEALALAREMGHPFSLADVLCFAGCLLSEMRRDAMALGAPSDELVRLANEKRMPTWLGIGTRCQGERLFMLGNVQEGIVHMRRGRAFDHAANVRIYVTGAIGFLAEAKAAADGAEEGLATLDDALALVNETNERYCEAELHRLRADLLLMQGDEEGKAGASQLQAERGFLDAIEVARRQRARSWELRAATSLARLWQKQGRVDEARQKLAEIYDWFSEGFDTRDLREAKALLEELA